jgi:hypothetical protein
MWSRFCNRTSNGRTTAELSLSGDQNSPNLKSKKFEPHVVRMKFFSIHKATLQESGQHASDTDVLTMGFFVFFFFLESRNQGLHWVIEHTKTTFSLKICDFRIRLPISVTLSEFWLSACDWSEAKFRHDSNRVLGIQIRLQMTATDPSVRGLVRRSNNYFLTSPCLQRSWFFGRLTWIGACGQGRRHIVGKKKIGNAHC